MRRILIALAVILLTACQPPQVTPESTPEDTEQPDLASTEEASPTRRPATSTPDAPTVLQLRTDTANEVPDDTLDIILFSGVGGGGDCGGIALSDATEAELLAMSEPSWPFEPLPLVVDDF